MATTTSTYTLNAGFNQYLEDIEVLTKEFLTELQEAFVAYLAANDRNATGKSSNSIQVVNVTPAGGQLIGGDWIQWVFTGRGTGGFPPLSAIIDWLNARGLPRGMAWNVAKKIAREGTELYRKGGRERNAFTEILTPERIQEFTKNISNLVAAELSSDITNIFSA